MKKVKINHLKALLFLAVFGSIFSCSNDATDKQSVLKHVVSLQFKEDLSTEIKDQAIQLFLDLKDSIPEIKKIEGGENISEGGPNTKFTHCFILTFDSEAARDIYLPHPAHKRVVERNKPLFSDLQVIDFWEQE